MYEEPTITTFSEEPLQLSAEYIAENRTTFCLSYPALTVDQSVEVLSESPTTIVAHGANLLFEDFNTERGLALAATLERANEEGLLQNVERIIFSGGKTHPTNPNLSEAQSMFSMFAKTLKENRGTKHIAILGPKNYTNGGQYRLYYDQGAKTIPVFIEGTSRTTQENISNTQALLDISRLESIEQLQLITGITCPGAHRTMMLWAQSLNNLGFGDILISAQEIKGEPLNRSSVGVWNYIRASKLAEKILTFLIVNEKHELARTFYQALQKQNLKRS